MQRNTAFAGGGDSLARAVFHGLICKGIKLLALDFDLTIVDVHTGGAWRGPVHQLAQHVRPCFRALMEAALETQLLHLCIVTYSAQKDMIQDLIRTALPHSDTSRILIQTSSKDWQQKNLLAKQSVGKQHHIAQVTTDLYKFRRAVIHPHEIILMDDDDENIDVARRSGHAAFLVKETVTLEDIYAFVEKIQGCEVAQPNSYSHLPEPFISAVNHSKYHPDEYKSSSLPRLGQSKSAHLTLSNVKKGTSTNMLDTGNFAIPRPTVVNRSTQHNPQIDMKIGRPNYDESQLHSTTFMTMTYGR